MQISLYSPLYCRSRESVFSASSTSGLKQYFCDYAAHQPDLIGMVPDLPVLPDGVLADLASRMTVLSGLPQSTI